MAKRGSSKAAPDARIHVDIVSDIVCPWCWLGARYFMDALKAVPFDVKLAWRPYMLDPDVPKDGVPYKAYMSDKFGEAPSDKFTAMRTHLEQAGPEVGIDFRFGGIPMRPNTLDAHRVMRWAEGQGKSDAMAERLFKAFFTEHLDIGKAGVLATLAGDVGLDADLVRDLLNTDKDAARITEEITFFRNLGVSGVPTFIYQGQYALSGAQPADAHINALKQAALTAQKTR